MEDQRAITVGDFRDFKSELRGELSAMRTSMSALETAHNALAIEIRDNRLEDQEKANAKERERLLQEARSSEKLAVLSLKTGVLWTGAASGLALMVKEVIAAFKGHA